MLGASVCGCLTVVRLASADTGLSPTLSEGFVDNTASDDAEAMTAAAVVCGSPVAMGIAEPPLDNKFGAASTSGTIVAAGMMGKVGAVFANDEFAISSATAGISGPLSSRRRLEAA